MLAVCARIRTPSESRESTAQARVVTYAGASDADFSARNLRFGPEGAQLRTSFGRATGRRRRVLLPMSGRHNVENAVGVFAVAMTLGISPEVVAQGLRHLQGRQAPAGSERARCAACW